MLAIAAPGLQADGMNILAWLIFVAAALLEVGGDAVVRKGLRGGGLLIIAAGMIMLGVYGVVVNSVKWDFSRLLGVYVAIFAVLAVAFGRIVFKENIPFATWLGLGIIVLGGLIIQFGPPTAQQPGANPDSRAEVIAKSDATHLRTFRSAGPAASQAGRGNSQP